MKRSTLLRRLAAGLAMAGTFAPQMASAAGPLPKGAPRTRSVAARPPMAVVADVALQNGGILAGQVVDGQGIAQAEAQVSLLQQGEVIRTAKTDEQGRFEIGGLKGGLYQIETAQGGGTYRLWAPRTAPPSAARGLLLVSAEQIQ